MEETLPLVDENDNEIGRETREKCHLGKGRMHRAIAVFLFTDKNSMLTQQRSQKKLLWPGYLDCAVATHVYPGETYEAASKRGLKQELGISARVEKILGFTYFAPFGKYAENEYCALLVGRCNGAIVPNPDEASSFKHVSIQELRAEMARNEETYTPWFKIALEKFFKHPYSQKFL